MQVSEQYETVSKREQTWNLQLMTSYEFISSCGSIIECLIEKTSNVLRTLSLTILIHESEAIESGSSEIVTRTSSAGLDFDSISEVKGKDWKF